MQTPNFKNIPAQLDIPDFCPSMKLYQCTVENLFNPLNAELNPICHFLALLAHPLLHISRIRVKIPQK
jgi:hypothetical protein